ncbi:unnamed protein product [Effrenium voratum]|uniref:Uncharacterized protein n=1 Tax=Effrenium voratum TaxID=2562239 RepID=A0AA36IT47_9DINO|nr:unnamed protein product [Effrenium voratum]
MKRHRKPVPRNRCCGSSCWKPCARTAGRRRRRRQQEFLLGQAFLTIYEESDPDYTDYTKNLSSSREMDFRRVGITVQDAIHRLVQHCEENLSDLPSLRRTLRILHAMLAVARGDWQREDLDLAKIQEEFARAGVSKLLVKVLNENPVDDAWSPEPRCPLR